MEIYDYSKIKTCFICGNIDENIDKFIKNVISGLSDLNNYIVEPHPKEVERQERLAKKKNGQGSIYAPRPLIRKKSVRMGCGYDLTDSLIIVSGCNCFGTRDLKYYHDKLKMLNTVLFDNKTHVVFVRGNDDPKYFEDGLINFSNIKTIKDYSIIKLNKFNCLCIGGCVSIDRAWRMEQEKRIGRKMYWKDEKVQYNEDDINKIVKDFNIACVVTAACPSFAYPGMNLFKNSVWALNDKNLIKDLTEERVIMDKIYNKIMESNNKPYLWAYGKFKNENQNIINDILFQSLSSFQFSNFNDIASSYFKVNFSKTLKKNEFVTSFAKKLDSFRFEFPEDDPLSDEDGPQMQEQIQENEVMGEDLGDQIYHININEGLGTIDGVAVNNAEGFGEQPATIETTQLYERIANEFVARFGNH